MRVLAVDPGRDKCGIAVCGPEGVLARQIVPIALLRDLATRLATQHAVDEVLVGDQTYHERVFAELKGLKGLPIQLVRERGSTLRARRRYFRDHPRRGWRLLWPSGLQVPPEPYDDYAAIVLAEEYLRTPAPERPPGAFPGQD